MQEKGEYYLTYSEKLYYLLARYTSTKESLWSIIFRAGMSFEVLEDKRVNIIIVGSGKVGYTLAQHLNAEGHEITVIDSDEEKIKDLSSEMDIYCVLGNGTSYRTQKKEAGIEKADLLISVANQDEVNLLSCLIAKKSR